MLVWRKEGWTSPEIGATWGSERWGTWKKKRRENAGHHVTGCRKDTTRRRSFCQIERMKTFRFPSFCPSKKGGHFPNLLVLPHGEKRSGYVLWTRRLKGQGKDLSQKLTEALLANAVVSCYQSCTPKIYSCSQTRTVSKISRTEVFTHLFMFVIMIDIYS